MNERLIDSYLRCSKPLEWVAWSQNPNLDEHTRRSLQAVLFDRDEHLREFTDRNRSQVVRCIERSKQLQMLVEKKLADLMEQWAETVEDLESKRRTAADENIRELHYVIFGQRAMRCRVREISEYVHDARLKIAGIRLEDGWAKIPLGRECWEYGFNRSDGSLELFIARSQLAVYPAKSFRLVGDDIGAKVPWISKVTIQFPAKSSSEVARVSCIGRSPNPWRLNVDIEESSRLVILLTDQERPYLWSKRYGTRRKSRK